MKPLYCGNIEYAVRQIEIERLFGRYGRVDRVDMKSGYAFIYMEDERDAEDAIRGLDNTEFGRQRRRLTVEWTKHADRGFRRYEDGRRSDTGSKPTKTLFVINFDPYNTRVRDLERHFGPYGNLVYVRIRRNFAFVRYELQEEATKALDSTHMSKMLDRVITVEYAQREDSDRRGGYSSPIRSGRYGRAADGRDHDQSASPMYHRRPVRDSPDYGRAPSPIYARRPQQYSPDHGRASSPIYARRPQQYSPDYGRAPSPIYARHPERHNHDSGRAASPVYASHPRRNSPDYDRVASPLHERYRSRSPVRQSRQPIAYNYS